MAAAVDRIKIANNRLVTMDQPYWCASATAALVVLIAWPYISTIEALALLTLLVTADRLLSFIVYRYEQDSERDERPDYWESRLVAGNFLAGVIWGSIGAVFYAQLPDTIAPLMGFITILVIGGWSISHVPSMKCILAFSLPSIFSIMVAAAIGGEFSDLIIGLTAPLFLIAVLRHSRIVSHAYRTSVEHSISLEKQAINNMTQKEIISQDHSRLSNLLDAMPLPIIVNRRDTSQILYLNRVALDLGGIKDFSEITGQKCSDYFVDPGEWNKLIEKVSQGKYSDYTEAEIKRGDGSAYWAHYSANQMNYQDIDAIIITLSDITAQRAAEEAQRISEENLRKAMELQNARLRNLLDSVPAPIIVGRKEDGLILYANKLAYEQTRIAEFNVGARTTEFFADPADRNKLARNINSGESIARFEFKMKRGDGTMVRVLYSGNDMNYEGHPAIIGTFIDITDRYDAEQAQRKSEEKFRLLADNANDWISIYSLEGVCLYSSPSVERVIGYTPDEILGTFLSNFVPPEDYKMIDLTNAKGAKTGGPSPRYTFRVRHKNGNMEWLESTSTVERDPATGRASHISSVSRLVTERVLYEQQLKDARERAEMADRAKSEFLAHMSHEIRTPLNAVIGFSEVMRDQLFGPLGSPRYLEYINDIHNSGVHLLELINDVLDLSKIEAGKFELQEDRVPLQTITDTALRFMNERAHAKNILLQNRLDAAPDIWGDRRVLTQVLLNLISNATKFTPERGKITLESRFEKNGDFQLMVTDTGIGISEEDLPVVMQPFGQARNSSQTATEPGTGLGLPLSRSFVEKHGGTLTLTSEVGIGTRVIITLPASRILNDEVNAKPGLSGAV